MKRAGLLWCYKFMDWPIPQSRRTRKSHIYQSCQSNISIINRQIQNLHNHGWLEAQNDKCRTYRNINNLKDIIYDQSNPTEMKFGDLHTKVLIQQEGLISGENSMVWQGNLRTYSMCEFLVQVTLAQEPEISMLQKWMAASKYHELLGRMFSLKSMPPHANIVESRLVISLKNSKQE